MGQGLFVTSSGTEIGKTFVTAALASQLREAGKTVAVFKPLLSGFDEADPGTSDPGTSDTGVLLRALGKEITQDAIAAMTPWRFQAALSPDMAAAREGREIDFGEVTAFTAKAFEREEDWVLMEGVGGLMAPIGQAHTVVDWIEAANVPALLVVGGYLGTISHTLTAAAALAARGIPLVGIVISATGALPVPAEETAQTISRFLPGVTITIVPDLGAAPDAWAGAPDLLGALEAAHTPA